MEMNKATWVAFTRWIDDEDCAAITELAPTVDPCGLRSAFWLHANRHFLALADARMFDVVFKCGVTLEDILTSPPDWWVKRLYKRTAGDGKVWQRILVKPGAINLPLNKSKGLFDLRNVKHVPWADIASNEHLLDALNRHGMKNVPEFVASLGSYKSQLVDCKADKSEAAKDAFSSKSTEFEANALLGTGKFRLPALISSACRNFHKSEQDMEGVLQDIRERVLQECKLATWPSVFWEIFALGEQPLRLVRDSGATLPDIRAPCLLKRDLDVARLKILLQWGMKVDVLRKMIAEFADQALATKRKDLLDFYVDVLLGKN